MNWTEISRSKDIEAVRIAVTQLDVNERDERGRTPLMLFLTNRMPIQAIELLIREGANLQAEDKLGDTALNKAVKFKQKEAIVRLLEAGVKLDSPQGILATAWNAARGNKEIADMLLETKGSLRLSLTPEEDEIVDDILYDELQESRCEKIVSLDSPELTETPERKLWKELAAGLKERLDQIHPA
ncbi:ankyrin repeat domain-containing protein [Fontibacillus sp. BL9]|uniref:ankyrin repeat domain-containing protein n=1 Tax=Fontibacillus sp. BL9 TaxID=3389971 RepID=UPI003978E885